MLQKVSIVKPRGGLPGLDAVCVERAIGLKGLSRRGQQEARRMGGQDNRVKETRSLSSR